MTEADKWDAEYTFCIPGQRPAIVPPCKLIEVWENQFQEFHVLGCQCKKARSEQLQRWIEEQDEQ